MTDEKEQEVRNILLTPIECTTHKQSSEIWIEHDNENHEISPCNGKFTSARIRSSQKYNSYALDPDMSDLAVGFYEIVYADVLKSLKLLNECGSYNNCIFLGDTMNSFNSIANNVPGAGQSTKQRTPKGDWPEFLQEYHSQYHCLANFWILPMCIGRTGTKLNHYDSVDIFLNKLQVKYSVLKKHADYFEQAKTYDEFCKKHFLKGYVPLPTDKVLEMYSKKHDKTEKKFIEDAKELIAQAYKCMEFRADSIISDETICEELYRFFKERKLLV